MRFTPFEPVPAANPPRGASALVRRARSVASRAPVFSLRAGNLRRARKRAAEPHKASAGTPRRHTASLSRARSASASRTPAMTLYRACRARASVSDRLACPSTCAPLNRNCALARALRSASTHATRLGCWPIRPQCRHMPAGISSRSGRPRRAADGGAIGPIVAPLRLRCAAIHVHANVHANVHAKCETSP